MRNAGDGVPYGGDLCDFAGVRWGSAGCAAERSMPVPYTGMYGFAFIQRLSVVYPAERHGGRSLRANYIRRAGASEQSRGPNGVI